MAESKHSAEIMHITSQLVSYRLKVFGIDAWQFESSCFLCDSLENRQITIKWICFYFRNVGEDFISVRNPYKGY